MFTQTISLKKITLLLSGLLLAFALMMAPKTSAAGVGQLCTGADFQFTGADGQCQVHETDEHGNPVNVAAESKITRLINNVVNIISIIVGIISVIMIIYGGFRMVTSGGNPENTKAARNAIIYALVGLLIVAFAQVIVKFVLSKIA